MRGCVHAQSCPTLCDCVPFQAPLSMGFSRQEYWSGLPFPSPEGIFPTQGWNPLQYLLHWQADFFYHLATWEVPSEGTELSNPRSKGRQRSRSPTEGAFVGRELLGAQGSWLWLLSGETSGELQRPRSCSCFRDQGAGQTAWDRWRQGWTQGSAQS